MASKDIKLSDIIIGLKKFGTLLKTRAGLIFVILVLGVMAYSVFAVNLLLNKESDVYYRAEKESATTSTQFDKSTIEKIEALGDRQNPPEPVIPDGRINPFAE